MKDKILAQLKKQKGYVSGQQLCRTFGVSRTAVWKAVNRLQQEGYEIEAVRNRGYRLLSSPDVLTEAEFAGQLPEAVRVLCLEEVDSTNEEAKRLAVNSRQSVHGTLILARRQTGGKGRRGRVWQSSADDGIWMTLLLQDDILPERASMLTLVAAMAVREGIERAAGISCGIKWPNDIVCEGKKVCGILTEMSAEEGYVHYIAIGIGINCNMESFSEELAQRAVSLKQLTGAPVHRADIVTEIMRSFFSYYKCFKRTQDMRILRQSYDSFLVNKDKDIEVLDPMGVYRARGVGLGDDGALVVETADGERRVYSGEVSVRGIYGYT